MTYSPTEPQDLPPPVTATAQIRTNFSQFQTVFSENHTALNNSNQGKHEAVIFEEQAIDPGVIGDYVAMYAKSVINTSSTAPQIFIQVPQFLPNNQPNLPEQLTFNSVNTAGPQYQTFLPGGYIMYFGNVSSVPVTITLSPVCSEILSVIANPNAFTSAILPGTFLPLTVFVNILNSTQFTINSMNLPATYSFKWVAIAKQ